MGDTLVYTAPSVSVPISQDTFPSQGFAHTTLPAALAATTTTTTAFATSKMALPQTTQQSPVRERRATEFTMPARPVPDGTQGGLDPTMQKPAIILRKLPRSIGQEGVRNMLLFAKDLVAVKLIDSLPEDAAHATAVAQFQTFAGALEAKESLDGKPNATQDARMIVELPSQSSPTDSAAARLGSRRSTIDGTAARTGGPQSATSAGEPKSSRFSSTFQSSGKISPPLPARGQSNGDFPVPESGTHLQSLFSPQSPMGNEVRDQQRNLGKSVINDDVVDDETDGLLRNPLAYVRDGRQSNVHRPSIPQMPTAQFGNMSLQQNNFDGPSPLSAPHSGLASPAAGPQHGAPFQQQNLNPRGSFSQGTPANVGGRTSYPPANPADQNPPCNTLYVGNLPNNTSEDELKRLFSQQRGYKRLCFRTKQNGPMCFVEFENITLATQALHHLYGKMLSNSVKGGIRLSFSKNPLGVRNGQVGMPPNAMSPHGAYQGPGGDIAPPPGFSSPAGPPPGLPPSGRGQGFGRPPPGADGMGPMYQAHQYSISGAPFASQLRMPPSAIYPGQGPPPSSGGYVPPYYDSAAR